MNLKEIITKDTLPRFAYTNMELCADARAVVLDFHGLNGGCEMIAEHGDTARQYAAHGVLYIYPYTSPWSWMNDTAVRTADAILDAALAGAPAAPDIPILSTGGSMGGLGALVFTRYSAHTIAACAANCPVCDLPFHYTERDDLPRTLYAAFAHYPMPLEKAMETASPLHLVPTLPRVPYYIVHGGADRAVIKEKHSDRLVAALRTQGYDVTYHEVPGMAHCDLDEKEMQAYMDFIWRHAGAAL